MERVGLEASRYLEGRETCCSQASIWEGVYADILVYVGVDDEKKMREET